MMALTAANYRNRFSPENLILMHSFANSETQKRRITLTLWKSERHYGPRIMNLAAQYESSRLPETGNTTCEPALASGVPNN